MSVNTDNRDVIVTKIAHYFQKSHQNFQNDGMNCCIASLQWQIFSDAFDFSVPYYYERLYKYMYDFTVLEFLLGKTRDFFSRIKKARERGVGHGGYCHTQCFLEIT